MKITKVHNGFAPFINSLQYIDSSQTWNGNRKYKKSNLMSSSPSHEQPFKSRYVDSIQNMLVQFKFWVQVKITNVAQQMYSFLMKKEKFGHLLVNILFLQHSWEKDAKKMQYLWVNM